MKLIILVACALVAVAVAGPVDSPPVEIVRSSNVPSPDGGYAYEFETSDGTKRQEVATVVEALDEENKPHQVLSVRGTFEFTDPEGHLQSISYVAGPEGFTATGDSIPKVPEARR